ncbi:hypothetical protein GTZ99_12270 [Novosphingobium sp. FSY-8]|uniref:Uncharacterized protein n=1 Tax=Novosphingobium ovatum TaxID=1908523 RepID=A0ABW9XFK7_9SPHN|nr:hypothetical protein [Novosphingobium ovatum]NBC37325.1 hypothetical protein [Novosphingobium ovatum]
MTADVITLKRWTAHITYRHDARNEVRMASFEELFELHDIIEAGPNFYAIESIVIRPGGRCAPTTVEKGDLFA